MDKRDLIEKLQDVLEYNHLYGLPTLTREDFIIIKGALDSANPSLPNNIKFTNLVERGFMPFKYGECPRCEFEVGEVNNFCTNCGKALVWKQY